MPKPRSIGRRRPVAAAREQSPKRPSVPLLRFLGATQTVTGSRFLIDTPDARVLVDCGLFQGLKALRERNWATFPVDPASIDAVVLTHAHLDHSGYVPALARNGYSGRLFATEGTVALSRIVLPDSGHIQEEDAAYANRKGFSKHLPALPLYTEEDALRAVQRFTPLPYDTAHEVATGVRATFRPAGHILGSASVAIDLDRGTPAHPRLQRRPRAPAPSDPAPAGAATGGGRGASRVDVRRPTARRCGVAAAFRGGDRSHRRAPWRRADPVVRCRPHGSDPVPFAKSHPRRADSRRCRCTSTAPWRWRR